MEINNLDNQKEKIAELIKDQQFLSKVVNVESKQKFIDCFANNGVTISSEDADLILNEVVKSRDKINNLSDEELLEVAGGRKTTVVVVEEHKEKRHKSDNSIPMPAIGVAATGGAVALIGTAIAIAGIVQGSKKGWFSTM